MRIATMLPSKTHAGDAASGKSSVVLRDDIKPNDVLFGRGAGIARCEGNVRLRRLIRERLHSYTATSRILFKDNLARDVVQEVRGRGGRFLRREGHTWVIVDNEKDIVIKVKQNFRDHAKSMYTSDVGEDGGETSDEPIHQGRLSLDQQIGGTVAHPTSSSVSSSIPPQWPQQPVQPPQQVVSNNQLNLAQQLLVSIQSQGILDGSSTRLAQTVPSEPPPRTTHTPLLQQPNTSSSENQALLGLLQSLTSTSTTTAQPQSLHPLPSSVLPVQAVSHTPSSTQGPPANNNAWLVQAQSLLAKLLINTLASPYTENTANTIEQIRQVLQEVNGQLQTQQPPRYSAPLPHTTSNVSCPSSNTNSSQVAAVQAMQQILATALQSNRTRQSSTSSAMGANPTSFTVNSPPVPIQSVPIEARITVPTSHGTTALPDTHTQLYQLLCSFNRSSQVAVQHQQSNTDSLTQQSMAVQQGGNSSSSSGPEPQVKKRSAADASLGNSGVYPSNRHFT